MKILKDPHHNPMFRPFGFAGAMRLVCSVMVYFDLDDPENPLDGQKMWPEVMRQLPQPQVLDPGLPKPRAEFLAAGACCVPDGKPAKAARARLTVGQATKTLDVFGDRHWIMAGNVAAGVSDPAPFTRMPLTWERAFGGPADARNPKGRGLPPGEPSEAPIPLPNVEYHDRLTGSPGDKPPPASFLPWDQMHPERQSKAGSYDEAWLEDRWPYFPDNVNPEFFLNAPPDQWLPGYFAGGEAIEIAGMHPTRPLIASRLPGFAVRLFLTRKESPKASPEKDMFEEVKLFRDTLWLFPEIARGVVVFRGVCAGREDMANLRYVYLATEAAGQAPRSLEHHLEAQTARIAAMKPVKPDIPDVEAEVNRELLKFNRVRKDIARFKEAALGNVPVMPRTPGEAAAKHQATVAAGLAVLDGAESMLADFSARFGWKPEAADLASIASGRARLGKLAAGIEAGALSAARDEADLAAMKDGLAGNMGAALKASMTPEQLAAAGIDPDDPVPEPADDFGPWHTRGLAFVIASRRHMPDFPNLHSVLKTCKFTEKTIASSWLGVNPAPVEMNGPDWGLAPCSFTLPLGMVLPTFDGRKLVRINILNERWAPRSFVTVPGSDPGPLFLPAPDEVAPVVVVAGELEALLMEQEVGDVCHVLALPSERDVPSPEAAGALNAAPAVLVVVAAGAKEPLSRATPYLALSPVAQWLPLAKGADCLRSMAEGGDLRELVLDALPPAVVGLPEDEPEPAYGPAPPRKRPAMPGIASLIAAAQAEIRAANEAEFADLAGSKQAVEDAARKTMAKHGRDMDKIMAEAEARPSPAFDTLSADMAARLRAKADALAAGGKIAPDKLAALTQAADQAERLGAEAEAGWQAGEQALAATAKKVEARRAAPGGVPEEMKAAFAAAGMDLDAMVKRTREEVEEMYEAGRPLRQAELDGVDLSGLDLSRADFTGASLVGTNFAKATLDGCVFADVSAQNADFSGASLEGARFDRAMLQRTSFSKAMLGEVSLLQAMIDKSDLSGADLSFARLRLTMITNSDLTGARLNGTDFSLASIEECLAKGASFKEAKLTRTAIRKTDLSGADFTGAAFVSSQLQECAGQGLVLAGAGFSKGALADCLFAGADLSGVTAGSLHVRGADLKGADLRGASLAKCRVENSSLAGARLSGASLRGTAFPGTDLEGADLRGADLLFASLAGARIVAADLRASNCFGVNFRKAVLGETRLEEANLKMTVLHKRADLLE